MKRPPHTLLSVAIAARTSTRDDVSTNKPTLHGRTNDRPRALATDPPAMAQIVEMACDAGHV